MKKLPLVVVAVLVLVLGAIGCAQNSSKTDEPYFSENEVKALIVQMLANNLPEKDKPFSKRGARVGEEWVREYEDFSSKGVYVEYLGNGEWKFLALSPGYELFSEYIQATKYRWYYQNTSTTYTLSVTGKFYERTYIIEVNDVQRLGVQSETSGWSVPYR